jgi:hypothetical protein
VVMCNNVKLSYAYDAFVCNMRYKINLMYSSRALAVGNFNNIYY